MMRCRMSGHSSITITLQRRTVDVLGATRALYMAILCEDGRRATYIDVDSRGYRTYKLMPIRLGSLDEDGLTRLLNTLRRDLEVYR